MICETRSHFATAFQTLPEPLLARGENFSGSELALEDTGRFRALIVPRATGLQQTWQRSVAGMTEPLPVPRIGDRSVMFSVGGDRRRGE